MNSNLFLIKIDKLYGYIGYNGNFLIQPCYKIADDFSDGLAYIKTINNEHAYINSDNQIIFKFDCIGRGYKFKNGFAPYLDKNRKFGFIDKNGEITISCSFNNIHREFNSDGYAIVKKDNKFMIINGYGESIIDSIYDGVGTISEGLIPVELNGKCGFIDINNNVKIDLKYDKVDSFSEGLAGILINGKWGYINKNEDIIIKPTFDFAYKFSDGYARVVYNNKYTFIDSNGMCFKKSFTRAEDLSESIAVVEVSKGKVGYINMDLKFITKPVFNTADSFKNGLGCVTYNGEWGYINQEGTWVYKPTGFDLW